MCVVGVVLVCKAVARAVATSGTNFVVSNYQINVVRVVLPVCKRVIALTSIPKVVCKIQCRDQDPGNTVLVVSVLLVLHKAVARAVVPASVILALYLRSNAVHEVRIIDPDTLFKSGRILLLIRYACIVKNLRGIQTASAPQSFQL